MKRIRVLIVEDSAVVRELLRRIISADSRLEVAAAVGSAEEAFEVLHRVAPDVISLDIRLPGMQGLEATRRIMAERPTPIVVVSASSQFEEINLTMEALKAGALSVVDKPAASTHSDYAALAGHLCTQLVIMSEVKVLRQRQIPSQPLRVSAAVRHSEAGYRVLAVAASTGGPSALMQVLGGLGRDFPLPILAVQHMTPSFVEGFGAWLAGVVPFSVELVCGRTRLSPGKVHLAPAARHLVVDDSWAWSDDSSPVSNFRPSANVLFASVARHFRMSGIGVVLTGMGDDGAEGLLKLRRAGGYTIAEDESTAVVYGMPAAGVRLGAVSESLPLPAIGRRIRELVEEA